MTTLTQHFNLGEPQVAGPLTVFPVFGPAPRLAYRSFVEAAHLGTLVNEVEGKASVNDVILGNPTDLPLLVYEGEEILGARQNRTFDVSVLVDAQAAVCVPVSCVEMHRWEDGRHNEAFAPSPQTADPTMRARKREVANRRALVGLEARPDQAEVWGDVEERMSAHGVSSDSAALSDVYEGRRDALDRIAGHVHRCDGQLGAVAFVGGRPAALDLVSRPDAFAALLPRLAQGYALDALLADEAAPDTFEAERFLHAALDAPRSPLPTPGMGRGVRIDIPEALGSGIEHGGELIQLCAFPRGGRRDDVGMQLDAAPIDRPSRRRARADRGRRARA